MEALPSRSSAPEGAALIDTTALFLHVLAAIGLVGGGITQVLAGGRVRTARTGTALASWARFTRQAGLVIAASAVVSLMTGGHLAGAVWTTDEVSGFSFPFITLGGIGLVLLGPVGPMVGGARLRRLIAAGEEVGDGPADVLASEVRSPALWGPVHSLVGVGVGFVALMVYKPGWVAGAVLLLVTFALGWLWGTLVARSPAG